MTYVTDQTSQELRAHMRRLKVMKGWNEPLADRLYREIVELDETVAKLRAAQAAQPERAPLSCTWTQEDDFDTPGVYHTSCGEMWSFTEGDIKGNNTKFCPHCGGGIKQGGQHD